MTKKKSNPKSTELILLCQLAQDAENCAVAFDLFERYYARFRKRANLAPTKGNAYELTTALADKTGRICRLVKHAQRKDPVENTPEIMADCVAGVIVYLEMLIKKYKLDMPAGFKRELKKAVAEHVKK